MVAPDIVVRTGNVSGVGVPDAADREDDGVCVVALPLIETPGVVEPVLAAALATLPVVVYPTLLPDVALPSATTLVDTLDKEEITPFVLATVTVDITVELNDVLTPVEAELSTAVPMGPPVLKDAAVVLGDSMTTVDTELKMITEDTTGGKTSLIGGMIGGGGRKLMDVKETGVMTALVELAAAEKPLKRLGGPAVTVMVGDRGDKGDVPRTVPELDATGAAVVFAEPEAVIPVPNVVGTLLVMDAVSAVVGPPAVTVIVGDREERFAVP